jgi:hypothetical protein
MKVLEKERARKLREKGLSINQIVKETGFSKASVSLWVRDIFLTKEQRKGLSEKGRSLESIERRRAARIFNEDKKRKFITNEAKRDFKKVTLNDLKLIGIILYLGEGSKNKRGTVAVTNSDPSVIKIMMRFFREICKVPESKFRGYIHTFQYADVKKTEKYWSQITGIPSKQFYKTYIKPSSVSKQKRKTLPFGTFDLSVNNTKLFLTIMGWIERIKELTT